MPRHSHKKMAQVGRLSLLDFGPMLSASPRRDPISLMPLSSDLVRSFANFDARDCLARFASCFLAINNGKLGRLLLNWLS